MFADQPKGCDGGSHRKERGNNPTDLNKRLWKDQILRVIKSIHDELLKDENREILRKSLNRPWKTRLPFWKREGPGRAVSVGQTPGIYARFSVWR
jgi:hypothetical protein